MVSSIEELQQYWHSKGVDNLGNWWDFLLDISKPAVIGQEGYF